MQKIFCIGQQAYTMNGINKEYLVLVHLVASNSTVDRNMFVSELGRLFTGRQNVSQTVFSNLIKVIGSVYDSYLPGEGSMHQFDLTDLDTVRNITQHYFV